RIAAQSRTILRIRNFRLHAPRLLELFVDATRFLNGPVHNHRTAQSGEGPFHKGRQKKRRHGELQSTTDDATSGLKAAFSGQLPCDHETIEPGGRQAGRIDPRLARLTGAISASRNGHRDEWPPGPREDS